MSTKAWMDNNEVERLEDLRKNFILFEPAIACNNFDNGVNLDAENLKVNSE